MTKKKAAFTINNKPSSLKQIRHAGQEDSLRRVLVDYVSVTGRVLATPSYEAGEAMEGFGQKRLKLLGFILGKTC